MICDHFWFNGFWRRQSVVALGLFCRLAESGHCHVISLVWIDYMSVI